MNENFYPYPTPEDMVADFTADPGYEPTPQADLNAPPWHDGKAWSDADWVYFPMSSNVYAARYCRDGSMRMQVMFGGKVRTSSKKGHYYDPIRYYEYGPSTILNEDAWWDFLGSPSKGQWTWRNTDVRWGSPVPYRPLL